MGYRPMQESDTNRKIPLIKDTTKVCKIVREMTVKNLQDKSDDKRMNNGYVSNLRGI